MRIVLVTGKGGVGKTTVAAATALASADRGYRTLYTGVDLSGWEDIHRGLLSRNDLEEAETALVYMQVTRGAAPRSHAFPKEPVPPTVYGFAKAFQRPSRERWERGFRAITWPDQK